VFYYPRQVNGVNGGNTVFVRCVSVCVCVCAQWTGQSDQFKTVKATDFKFDVYVSTDSPDMTLTNFSKKRGVCKNPLGGDMHSHERILVANVLFYM